MRDRTDSLSKMLQHQIDHRIAFDPVSELSTILEAIPDRTKFLAALLRTARRCFLSNHEAILSYHQPTGRWFVEAAKDVEEETLDELKGLSHTVVEHTLRESSSLLVTDAMTDELLRSSRSVKAYNIQAILTAPIYVKSEIWGLIYLANTAVPNAFDTESRVQLERFAKFAGIAISQCEEFIRLGPGPVKFDEEPPELLEEVRNAQMSAVLGILRRAAPSDVPVLLQGETGTGKDVLARWVHKHSHRNQKPMIQINCAELATTLIEAELFGIESGVATGVGFREGKIKIADGGSVFLNEIGELPLSMQAKLLRAIEDRVVERVGGRTELGVDVRFILATNQDVAARVDAGEFRRDLYYRINVFEVHVPNLRDRSEDIPALALNILARICRRSKRPMMKISDRALQFLMQREWKGNIRELANLIERSVVLSTGDELSLGMGDTETRGSSVAATTRSRASLKKAVEDFETTHIRQSLQKCGWVEARAAKLLGIPSGTLRYKMKKYGIKRPRRMK